MSPTRTPWHNRSPWASNDVGRAGGRRLRGRYRDFGSAGGSWAWVAGGLPGALAWLAFPLWVLLAARDAAWEAHR